MSNVLINKLLGYDAKFQLQISHCSHVIIKLQYLFNYVDGTLKKHS